MHCHHEKLVIVDDEVAFVGGIDLTSLGGDRFDTHEHPTRAAARLARRRAPHARARRRRRRRALRRSAGARSTGEALRRRPRRAAGRRATRACRSCAPSPSRSTASPRAATSGSSRPTSRALRSAAAARLPGEPVPVVARDRGDPRRKAAPPAERRLPPRRAAAGQPEQRRRRHARPARPRSLDADDGAGRFLAATVSARTGELRARSTCTRRSAIVDDRWLTIGSANLNDHSLFNDTEMNVVTRDAGARPRDAAAALVRASGVPVERGERRPAAVVDELWRPIAEEQLERRRSGEQPLTHRLVELPGVSRRSMALLGPLDTSWSTAEHQGAVDTLRSFPGRLAQLGERRLDKAEVTGSSPVSPIAQKPRKSGVFCCRGSADMGPPLPGSPGIAVLEPNRLCRYCAPSVLLAQGVRHRGTVLAGLIENRKRPKEYALGA